MSKALTPPSALTGAALEEWIRIAPDLQARGTLESQSVAAYCMAYARWMDAEGKVLETGGDVVKAASGHPMQNPYRTTANKALEQMRQFMRDLDMTPRDADIPPPPLGTLVPQAHGGAIRRGNPGNKGGRPTTAIRRRLRDAGAHRIKVLKEIADNPREGATDRLKAVDLMLRHGLGHGMAIDEVRANLKAEIRLAESWDGRVFVAEEYIESMKKIWQGD